MDNSSKNISLSKKKKEKFVKKMMNLAVKAKKSSRKEISSKIDKKIRHFEIINDLAYIVTIVITILLTYFIVNSYY